MTPKVFITGSLGYVGGSTTKALLEAYAAYEVTALVRDETQRNTLKESWPTVKTVIGNLDDETVLSEEGSKVDIVLSTFSIVFRIYFCVI
jgi:Predicted nucleoside-diphosphate-sugar epimerases